MIFIILLVAILIYVLFYVIKKECFTSGSYTQTNKYTLYEITQSVNALLEHLNEPHYLVRVNYVERSGAHISFNILAFNQKRYKVNNFYAKVKIPLSKNGKYTLIDSYVSDSKDEIRNGVHSLKDSQFYEKRLMEK
jgi:lipopolysaccharide export LptBFGC system permease protein LptF